MWNITDHVWHPKWIWNRHKHTKLRAIPWEDKWSKERKVFRISEPMNWSTSFRKPSGITHTKLQNCSFHWLIASTILYPKKVDTKEKSLYFFCHLGSGKSTICYRMHENWSTDKQTVIYEYNEIFREHKEWQIFRIQRNMRREAKPTECNNSI